MFDKSIRNKVTLYIISLSLISSFFINIDVLAESNLSQEPYEIWQENSVISEIESSVEKSNTQEAVNLTNQTVKQENFLFTKADAIGLYDPTNGGFEANLWDGSNIEDIAYLINTAPVESTSSTLTNLVKNVILTTAAPPDKSNSDSLSFLNLKSDFLISRGYYKNISQLFSLLNSDEINDILSDGMIDNLLIYNQYKRICNSNSNLISERLSDLYFASFCNAMSANKLTLDLNISLMRDDNNSYNEEYLSLLSEIIYSDEIKAENLKEINLINLNLLQKYNVDIDKYISINSPIKFKLFYFLNYKKNNLKKISIAEELVKKGLVEHKYLAEIYQSFDLSNTKDAGEDNLALLERIKIFKDIRKTSSQAELVNKIPEYVSLFSAHGMLDTASLMIYDKIKIVQPKPDYIDNASGICLVFILNDDPEKCNEWVSQLNLNSNTLELSKAKFYLSLANGKAIKETNLNQLIDYEGFSDRQKNIIVKYYELITNSKKISYWKTPNELNKVSSITANIKLHNYFESLENQIGEKIILLNILHGDDNFNENDEFSIFLIIDSLFEINEAYAQDYILEYFSTYNL
jgi:hypothetical protein|tara:strand:+ start:3650 stop:5383 length:1734 start_codon:yes stop_codon:yes gene_type:complete